LPVLVLVVPNLEGLEGLDVVDLVEDGAKVFDNVRAERLDVLLSKGNTSYQLSLILWI
jgi:hypothetical protein